MRFEFKLPDIGEGVVEGEVVRWLVKPGDKVGADQPLVEVMTDKATVVIPSPKAGKVLETTGSEGDMVKVHATLVVLDVAEGATSSAPTPAPAPAAAASSSPAPAAAASPTQAKPPPAAPRSPQPAAPAPTSALAAAPAPISEPSRPAGARVLATPVTRKLAAERGLDLAQVAGSGPGGRVMKDDVLGLAPATNGRTVAPMRVVSGGEERIPIRGLRKRIAEKMQRSVRTAAHFTFVEELDATRLVETRRRINELQGSAEDGVKISFLPFIVKAVVMALKRFPTLNASVDDEKQELVLKHSYNIGVAAATPDGLIVPVIHGADQRNIKELAREIERLGAEARAGKSRLEDLQGGTFTITSLGVMGGLFATPVINHPEVAILGVHRMQPRPVVRDGQVVIRDMMNLACAFDHRVIDGAVGAQFTYEIIKRLEDPELLLLES